MPEKATKTYPSIGMQIPSILLPRQGTDLHKWAVVACDQFTSEPEYWSQVAQIVGDAPSTLHMIFPEVWLGKTGEAERIQNVQAAMRQYLQAGLFEEQAGLVYVERNVDHRLRKGLMVCLDLEMYDYNKGSQSLIRATEGTIIERLPPRIKIRQGAALEFPHILVLIDDPHHTVIEQATRARDRLTKVYDFELMQGSGHLTGYRVDDAGLEEQIVQALHRLANPTVFAEKYGVGADQAVLLFAMGDGNHSLATAKAIWEKIKPEVGMDHPARYALVEIENVHDEGLEFEPIHRVLFGVKFDLPARLADHFGQNFTYLPCADFQQMKEQVENGDPGRQSEGQSSGVIAAGQSIGVIAPGQFGVLRLQHPASNLAVGNLQPFLDRLLKEKAAESIDYLHGDEVLVRLGSQPGNLGFYLPKMEKSDLFKTVILDGALPRKTFSMGEAREKRFYMEGRRIGNLSE